MAHYTDEFIPLIIQRLFLSDVSHDDDYAIYISALADSELVFDRKDRHA